MAVMIGLSSSLTFFGDGEEGVASTVGCAALVVPASRAVSVLMFFVALAVLASRAILAVLASRAISVALSFAVPGVS